MKQNLKIVLTGIGMCIVSFGVLLFVRDILLGLTNSLTEQYLIFNFTSLDANLIFLCPIIIALIQIVLKIERVDFLMKSVFFTLIGIILMIFIGLIVALITWESEDGQLLPGYYKFQPFVNFWTIFIALGMLSSVISIYFYSKSAGFKNRRYDTLDTRINDDVLDDI